jgi:hypothetical protein
MAHSLITMLRTLSTFGATWLKSPQCRELKITLSGMEFEMPGARSERLTAEHVQAIRGKARLMGVPSMALAQSLQSELGLRQKDCIGEWVPISEPGTPSDVIDGSMKWLRGIRWNEIDENLILRHTPSNQQKPVEFDLKRAPMVLEDLQASYCKAGETVTRAALPSSGPVIVYEKTGRPYLTHQFRRVWRAVATAADVPKTVMNMDSRSGTAGESDDARTQIGGR